jgi:hypothetical protein
MSGADISLAGGWIEVASIVRSPGEAVVSMRPVSVFAKGPGSEIEQLRAELQGRWRQPARAVMALLSAHGLPPSQIAGLLDCHPATVRRWISRFNREGLAGLADRPRSGRPRLGGRQLTSRITTLLEHPGPRTLPRIRRTWAGRRSACAPCTGGSGWWRSGTSGTVDINDTHRDFTGKRMMSLCGSGIL